MENKITKLNTLLIAAVFFLSLFLIDGFIYFRAKNNAQIIKNGAVDEDTGKISELYANIVNSVNAINDADPKTWPVYKNKQFGFEFHYPSYFKEFSPPPSTYDKGMVFMTIFINDEFSGPMNVMAYNQTLEKVMAEFSNEKTVWEDVIIDIPAKKTIIKANTGKEMSIVVLEKDNKIFVITGENNKAFNKTLSTFVFTR